MPMQAHEIEALLRETFPDAQIEVGGSGHSKNWSA